MRNLVIAFVVFQSILSNAQTINNDMPVAFGFGESYDQYTPVIAPAYTVYQLPYGIDFYGAAFTGPNVPSGHGLFYTTRVPCGTGQSCDNSAKTQQIIDLDLSEMLITGLKDMNMSETGYFTDSNDDNIQDGTYSYFLSRGLIDGYWYFNKWSTGFQTLYASLNVFFANQMVLDLSRDAAYILGSDEYGRFLVRKIDLVTMTVVPFLNSTIWQGFNTTSIQRIAFDPQLNQLYTVAFPIFGGFAQLICIDGQTGMMVGSPSYLDIYPPNEIFFLEIYNGNIYIGYTLPRGSSWNDAVAAQPCTLISRLMMESPQTIATFNMGRFGGHTFVGSNLYLGSAAGELIKFNIGSDLSMQDRMVLQAHMANPPSCSSGEGPIISTMGVLPDDPNTMYITGTWWSLIIVVHLDRFSSAIPCRSSDPLNGFPIWAVILICLGGIGVITALVVLSVRAIIRHRRQHQHYHQLTTVVTYH